MEDPRPVSERFVGALRDNDPLAVVMGAVERGWISRSQAEECLAEAEPQMLGRYLIGRGWLTSEQAVALQAQAVVPDPSRIPAGVQVGRYVVLREIGHGAMATVYEAHDPGLGRRVALKVLATQPGSEMLIQRLQREATIIAKLRHPNIVTVHEVGVQDGLHYAAMDLIDGGTLADVPPRLPVRETARLIEIVARAVQHAHDHRVVHRDLKPTNILMDRTGQPLVADFGLARSEEEADLTVSGQVLGTPGYMAPEQVQGRNRQVGPAADIWALGVMLYELVSERRPFTGGNVAEISRKILWEEPARLPGAIGVIAGKAMEKEPRRRYATAGELAEDLRRYLAGEPIHARPPSLWSRFGSRLRRNRAAFWMAAAGALGIATALAILLPAWRSAEEAARERDEARKRAEEAASKARERERAAKELGTIWLRVVLAKRRTRESAAVPQEILRELGEAIAQASEYVHRHPDHPQGYYVRARGLLYAGDTDGAERDLHEALRREPAFTPGWALLAKVKLEQYVGSLVVPEDQLGQGHQGNAALLKEAEEALRHGSQEGGEETVAERWGLIRDDREDQVDETLIRAMRKAYLDRDWTAASEMLRRAHEAGPSEQYCEWLGIWSDGYDEKLAWLNQAVEIAPNDAEVYVDRGNAHYLAGQIDRAIADYDHGAEINPGSSEARENGSVAHNKRGIDRMMTQEDLKGAVADFDRAIALRPAWAPAYNSRAVAKYTLRDLAGALADCNRAIEIDGSYANAYLSRANTYLLQEKYYPAVADLRSALRLAPPDWPYREGAEKLLRDLEALRPHPGK